MWEYHVLFFLCHWMEATNQLRGNSVAVDTSTRVSTLSRSVRWWTPNKENFCFQIPGQLCRWTIIVQSTLQQNALKIQNKVRLLKYVARSRTSSMKARNLIFQAFIQPYFQVIYAVWPLLSNSSTEKTEAKNRQVHRLLQNWSDATNDEVRWFPNFQTAETKAQRFLRLFIDKAIATSPELFDEYILSVVMSMYLQLHVTGPSFIDALTRGRFNKYVTDWMKSMSDEKRQCYLDRLSSMLQQGMSRTH